jgi:hypothetical protein
MNLFDVLRSDGSIVVNKKLARKIGLQEAIVYSELLSRYFYFADRNMLKDGMFFNTVQDLQEATTLSGKQQKKAIDKLTDLNLIAVKVRGIPATRYFILNLDQKCLIDILESIEPTMFDKNGKKCRTRTAKSA